jgi:hypothetical protein
MDSVCRSSRNRDLAGDLDVAAIRHQRFVVTWTRSTSEFQAGTVTVAGCFLVSLPAFKFVLVFIALLP